MQVAVHELVDLLFKQDLGNLKVDLNLHMLKDFRDLFYFCFDLLAKGLVTVVGDGKTITLDDLSEEQFDQVKSRMLIAGILVHKVSRPNESSDPSTIVFKEPGVTTPTSIQDFSADIIMVNAIHTITFELVHNI